LTIFFVLEQSLQVVLVVEVSKVVDEVEVVGVVPGVVVEVVEALGVVPGVVRRLYSSLIDILVFSSPKGKTISSSRRTWSQEKVFMVRSEYLSRAASTTQKSSIAYGILSGVSWQRVYWVAWIRFSSNLEKRYYISVQLAARVSAM